MVGVSFQAVATSRIPQWANLLTPTLDANNAGWDGFCIVDQLPAISSLGINYRLTLTPPTSGANLVIASCFIGMANTAPSFDGNQVQVKFSGANGTTLTAGGSVVVSDSIAPTVQFNTSGNLLIAFGITSGDIRRNAALAGYTLHFKSADAANAGTTTKSGYSSSATQVGIVSKLEALA